MGLAVRYPVAEKYPGGEKRLRPADGTSERSQAMT